MLAGGYKNNCPACKELINPCINKLVGNIEFDHFEHPRQLIWAVHGKLCYTVKKMCSV